MSGFAVLIHPNSILYTQDGFFQGFSQLIAESSKGGIQGLWKSKTHCL